MELDNEITISIREIFERPEYYGRSLNDIEVQEIANNLVFFGELLMCYAKDKLKIDG